MVGLEQDAKNASGFYAPLVWPSTPPADIPFANRTSQGDSIYWSPQKEYTEFTDADTWFPSWAEDGEMYSPFEDGSVKAAGGKNRGRWRTGDQGQPGLCEDYRQRSLEPVHHRTRKPPRIGIAVRREVRVR